MAVPLQRQQCKNATNECDRFGRIKWSCRRWDVRTHLVTHTSALSSSLASDHVEQNAERVVEGSLLQLVRRWINAASVLFLHQCLSAGPNGLNELVGRVQMSLSAQDMQKIALSFFDVSVRRRLPSCGRRRPSQRMTPNWRPGSLGVLAVVRRRLQGSFRRPNQGAGVPLLYVPEADCKRGIKATAL